MKTANISFIRGEYLRTSANNHETKIDFELQQTKRDLNTSLLTNVIRLEVDNGFHDRSLFFDYWIYLKNEFWKNSLKTGLAESKIKGVFFGDIPRELDLSTKTEKGKNFENPQHFIIVNSNNLKQYLTLDIFENLFFRKRSVREMFIKDHYIKHFA